jgi:predicted DNA-binding protein YlxM (UPF0122 family)
MLVACAIGAMGWIGIFLCHRSTLALEQNFRETLNRSAENLEAMYQDNLSLIAHNDELRQKMTDVIKTTQTHQKDYANTLQTLNSLQEELAFYQKLVTSPRSLPKHIVLKRFTVHYNETTDQYACQLLLTQATHLQKGTLNLEIIGEEAGQKKHLTLSQITVETRSEWGYTAAYFQRLQGYLRLPKTFTPHRIIVRMLPQGDKKARVETLRWKDLVSKEQS